MSLEFQSWNVMAKVPFVSPYTNIHTLNSFLDDVLSKLSNIHYIFLKVQ